MKGLALIGTLTRIHPSWRKNPFAVIALSLAGRPFPSGIRCRCCGKKVRKAFIAPHLTGFPFTLFACSCTSFAQLSSESNPDAETWKQKATEAASLPTGATEIKTAMLEEKDDSYGLN